MNIKKQNLELLFNLAKGTEGLLSLTESRVRDSFIKPLALLTQTYFDDRNEIYKAFCIKKEDGTPDLKNEDQYQFVKESLALINPELITLGDEEVDVNFSDNPQNIKNILEKSEYKPKVGEAEIVDNILSSI